MSKNYQIKYSAILDDLTPAGVRSIIANMKRLAEAQKKIDKERITHKQQVLGKLAASKELSSRAELDKKIHNADLARYKQLLGRKSLMEKTQQLRKLKGDEAGLKRYMSTQKGIISRLGNKFFDGKDYAGKSDNLAQQLVAQGRLNRAEQMLGQSITSNNRKREQAVRLQRQMVDTRRNTQIGMGIAATGGLMAGKAGLQNSFAAGMNLEEMGISMRAFLGESVGTKVLKDMKQFAKETGFGIQDTTSLAMGLKAASTSGAIKFSEDEGKRGDQIGGLARIIGRPVLAYGRGKDGRREIITQLQQIMGRGYTDIKRDLDVMQAHGFYALKPEIEKILGKSIYALDDGEKVKSGVMLQAFINASKSSEVDYAIGEKMKSFSQAVDSLGEQATFTSGGFGLFLAKTLGLPPLLNSVNGGLSTLEEKLSGVDGKFDMTKISTLSATQQLILFGTTTLAITLGIVALTGSVALLAKTAGGLSSLGRAFGIASAIYLVMSDWKTLFADIDKEFVGGIMKHMDMLIASLAVLGGGFMAGGWAGMAVAAVGLTTLAAGNKILYNVEKYNEKAWAEDISRLNAANPEMTLIGPTKAISTPVGPSAIAEAIKSLGIVINNNIDATTGKTKTKVDVYANPLFAGAWAHP